MAYGHAENKYNLKNQPGFTIVELLIVVVVIAILAAITIVAYNGIQNRAKISNVQSTASQVTKKLSTYAITNGELYPTVANFTTATGFTLSNDGSTPYQYSVSSDQKTFCLTTTVNKLSYYTTQSSMKPTEGACAGHGANGVATITNLHPNPGAVNASGTGFGSWAGSGGNIGTPFVVSAPWSASGSAFRMTWTTIGSADSGDISVRFDTGQLQPDTKYTAVYKLKGPNRSSWVTSQAIYAATAGTWTTFDKFPTTTQSLAANQVVERWITFSATAAGFSSGLRAPQSLTSKIANDTLEISEAIIYEGDYVPGRQWAWGDSSGWAWTGAVHNSPSTGPAL